MKILLSNKNKCFIKNQHKIQKKEEVLQSKYRLCKRNGKILL